MMFWMRRPVSKNLIGIVFFLLASLALLLLIVPILLIAFPTLSISRSVGEADQLLRLLQYQPFFYLAPLLATLLIAKAYDRMPIAWTGLGPHRLMLREIAFGIALGLGTATLAWLPVALTGSVAIGEIGSWRTLLLWSGILLANAAGEEILFRGYLFQRVVEIVGPVGGTLLVSGGFALAHLSNPGVSDIGVINTFLAGILFSACWFLTGSLWMSIAFHAVWNSALALLFGVPMSGIETGSSLLRTISAGPTLLTGGAFGPEGGIIATAVLVLGGGVLFGFARPVFSPYVFSRIFWGVHRQKMRKFPLKSDRDNATEIGGNP